MGYFYPDQNIRSLPDFCGSQLSVHIVYILFNITFHSLTDNVEKCKHPDS